MIVMSTNPRLLSTWSLNISYPYISTRAIRACAPMVDAACVHQGAQLSHRGGGGVGELPRWRQSVRCVTPFREIGLKKVKKV